MEDFENPPLLQWSLALRSQPRLLLFSVARLTPELRLARLGERAALRSVLFFAVCAHGRPGIYCGLSLSASASALVWQNLACPASLILFT